MRAAILFAGGAFRWYSMVRNSCTYLLTQRSGASCPLPMWEVVQKNRSLTVTSDMVIQLVNGRGHGCGQDVSDLAKQLLLPPLKTLCSFRESALERR